jgi:hypothetical protein
MSKFSQKAAVLILTLVIIGSFAHAELIPDPVSLVAKPLTPAPGEEFLVEASTPTFDKNTATFSWIVDGRLRPDLSGQGKNAISLKADKVGSVIRVGVEVSTPQGLGGSASLVIRVSDLVLTWFAETYVPKWYKGKPLPIPESVVSIVAVPQILIGGRTLAPSSLIYRWDLDDQEKALTGVGEQVFRIKTSLFPQNLHQIKVIVEDSGGQIRQEKEVFIVSREPRVVIYQSSPLGGIEFRSAPAVSIASKDETRDLLAEPFYFPVSSKKNLSYRWNVAGTEFIGNTGREFSVSLNIGSLPLQLTPVVVSVLLANSLSPTISGAINIFSQ